MAAPPEGDSTLAWRIGAVERAARQLDIEKADAKDVLRLANEFAGLRRTLQWFVGIVCTALVAFAGIVVQLVR